MTWEKCLLGDIIEIKKGSYITKKEAADGPYPVILGGQEPAYYIDRFNHTGKAIVVSRSGASAGFVSRWNEPIFVTDGFLIEPKETVTFDYLYYLMKMHQPQLQGLQGGAAIPHVNPRIIRAIEVILPSINEQQHIVSVLSPYDYLIENSQKQIKLLEEAAQRLYKEWFIDLRFPGHESTPIHDGVPEGWEKCTLNSIAKVNAYSIPNDYVFDYLDYIDLSSVNIGEIMSRTRYTITEAPGRAKRIAHDGDIIWGMVRPNLKSYALVLHPSDTDVFSTGFSVLSAKLVPFTYLYCAVTQHSFVSYLVNCTNGAAYPAVRPEHFEKAIIMKPTNDILQRFHEITKPLFRKTEVIRNQNNQLIEARNRLLPKLMSGEIEV